MIQFDLHIFFKRVGEKPPTRYIHIYIYCTYICQLTMRVREISSDPIIEVMGSMNSSTFNNATTWHNTTLDADITWKSGGNVSFCSKLKPSEPLYSQWNHWRLFEWRLLDLLGFPQRYLQIYQMFWRASDPWIQYIWLAALPRGPAQALCKTNSMGRLYQLLYPFGVNISSNRSARSSVCVFFLVGRTSGFIWAQKCANTEPGRISGWWNLYDQISPSFFYFVSPFFVGKD